MNTPIRVAVIEDDPDQRDYIARCLDQQFELLLCQDADEFLQLSLTRPADMLLLDWTLPGLSGAELATLLRLRGNALPIAMMSVRFDEDSVIEALDAGANDFLVKPLRPRELNARLRALLPDNAGQEEPHRQQ